jgi:DNA-binding NarL/FixJ family response regulator
MNQRDPHSASERWRLRPEHAAPHWGARPARVVLIESRTLFRECLAHALMTFLPNVSIEGVNSADDVAPGPAALLLIGHNPLSGCEPAQLRETFQTLLRLSDGSPIGAYLHAHDMAVAASLAKLGVAGIVMPDASLEIVVASVRLMVAGGTLLPLDLADHWQENDVISPSANLSPQHVAPRALARLNELLLPHSDLTVRERDVFKSLSAGRANKHIAFDLQMSENTVKVHLRNIMKKLHATNRTQAAMQFGALAAEIESS